MESCIDTCPIVAGLSENDRQLILQNCAQACITGALHMQGPVCGSPNANAKNVAVKAAIAASRVTELSTL